MIKFGTGGWRAIIGDEFTRENIQRFAKAMATKIVAEGYKEQGIVIGYDRRFLSRETVRWVCEVMAAEGIKTYFVDRSVPTPLVMYYVMKYGYPYGFMVTASHNPALYNGIKVFTEGGRDASEEQTQDIEKYLIEVRDEEIFRVPFDSALEEGLVEYIYPMNEYLDNIINNLNMEAIKNAGIKVAFDPMYGVSQTALNMILLSARCDVEVIHGQHDTLFGGKMPSPSRETLKLLTHYVVDKRCDVGIATDGDGDRLGVIDDKGRFLHPNDILVMLYYYLVKYKGWSGPVVRNLATTHMLDKVAERFGQKCYEVPVGFKNISSKMLETGAILGGESSGGLTVEGHINGKDGVYAAALLIEMMAVTGKKLSKIVEEIQNECGKIHMEERDYTFSMKKKVEMQQKLFEEQKLPDLSAYEIDKVSYSDGCKVYFKDGGWVIARFSGTEPLLRLFCEMPSVADAKAICSLFEAFLDLESQS